MALLTDTDWKSVFRGLIVAMVGAGLTYFVEFISRMDFGIWTLLIGAAVSTLVNIIRKIIDKPVEEKTGVQI